jgi:hypothetical protein
MGEQSLLHNSNEFKCLKWVNSIYICVQIHLKMDELLFWKLFVWISQNWNHFKKKVHQKKKTITPIYIAKLKF